MKKWGNGICLVLMVSTMLLFISCQTSQEKPKRELEFVNTQYRALTHSVINEYLDEFGGDREKVKKELQIYMSNNVDLHFYSSNPGITIDPNDKAVIRHKVPKKVITIKRGLKGSVRGLKYNEHTGYYELEVAFENRQPNLNISFYQRNPGANAFYFINVNNQAEKRIKYGNDDYTVSYSGEEPYLVYIDKEAQDEEGEHIEAIGLDAGE
jgi:hypothetical protein